MPIESRNLQVVFFDAAGTLFEVRGSVGEIYSTELRRFGVNVPPVELEHAFVEVFRRRSRTFPQGAGLHHAQLEKQWWFELVREVLAGRVPAATLRQYFEAVFERFRGKTAWRLFPDTVPCLDSLRLAGFRLGIISNFDSRLKHLLEDLGIGGFFENVTLSWCVGAAKPDAGIFLSALAAMKVPPSSAVHVGDSRQDDFFGARGAGLQAVLLDRLNVHRDWPYGLRIRSLRNLHSILLANDLCKSHPESSN
jgi:putative hydrolase of the HAD superfamily